MRPAVLDLVRAANREAKRFLSFDFGVERNGISELKKMFDLVQRVGEGLDPGTIREASSNPATSSLLAEYRLNLEQVERFLSTLKSELLERRRDLQAEESRLSAARDWAAGYRETF